MSFTQCEAHVVCAPALAEAQRARLSHRQTPG